MVAQSMGQLEREDMKIYTKLVINIQTGLILYEESYEYSGPVALCDRSQQAAADAARTQAQQSAGGYGATAAGISGGLVPELQRWTVAPPGYGPQGLAEMQTSALQGARARSGAVEEASRLRALRTGNAAGLGSLEAAEAQGGARGAGSAIEDILAKNAMLKSSQQQQAMGELGNLYGTSLRGDIAAQGLVPEDIKANLAAGQQGWLQNAEGIVQMLGGAATAGTGFKALAK
jgi:hypothetical protein